MYTGYKLAVVSVLSLLAFGARPSAAQEQVGSDSAIEVLTRGPVHEAFAEPVGLTPQAAPVIPKRPPDPIDEVPPEARPADADAEWVSGYWAWDDERDDFLWVSGVWRVAPTNHRWVAGHWAEVPGGFQRVSGFWAPEEARELTYLPYPPESMETGPNQPQPSADHYWVPGCWIYQDARYQWRPGYWAIASPDWIWVAAHYVWTPAGCLFVDGYWDHPLDRRGLLLAPVYFHRPIYRQRGYFYTPSVTINLNVLVNHFFCRPRYHHYYFGDYYGDHYVRGGFLPWFALNTRSHRYDPIYSHRNWEYGRRDPQWQQRHRERYDHFAQNKEARPPRTFDEQRQVAQRDRRGDDFVVATSLREAMTDSRLPLRTLDEQQRRQFKQQAEVAQRTAQQRAQLERADRGDIRGPAQPGIGLKLPEPGKPADAARPDRVRPEPAETAPQLPRPGADRIDRADRPKPDRPETTEPPGTRQPPPRPDAPLQDLRRPDTTPRLPPPGTTRPELDTPRTDRREVPPRDRSDVPPRTTPPRPPVGAEGPRTAPPANVPRPEVTPPSAKPPLTTPPSTVTPSPRTDPSLPSTPPATRRLPGLQPPTSAPEPRTSNRLPLDGGRSTPRAEPPRSSDRPPAPSAVPAPRPTDRAPPPAATPPTPRVAPQPRVERPAPQPERAAPQPKVNPAPQPRASPPAPQPQVNRPAPQPQVSRPAPQPQVNRPAPQPQVNRPAPQPAPRSNPPAGKSGGGGGKPEKSDKQDKK